MLFTCTRRSTWRPTPYEHKCTGKKIAMLEIEDTYVIRIGLHTETTHFFGTPLIGMKFSRWSRLATPSWPFLCSTKTPELLRQFRADNAAASVVDVFLLPLLLLLPSQVCSAAVTVGSVLPSLLLLSCCPCCRQFNFAQAILLSLMSFCRHICRLAASAKPIQVCSASVAVSAVLLPYHCQQSTTTNSSSWFFHWSCISDVSVTYWRCPVVVANLTYRHCCWCRCLCCPTVAVAAISLRLLMPYCRCSWCQSKLDYGGLPVLVSRPSDWRWHPPCAALFSALEKRWVSGVVDYEAFADSWSLRASVNLYICAPWQRLVAPPSSSCGVSQGAACRALIILPSWLLTATGWLPPSTYCST